MLTRLWTGQWPADRAPLAHRITIDGRSPTDGPRFAPGATATVRVDVDDPEGDPFGVRWTLRTEVVERSRGGLPEAPGRIVPMEVLSRASEPGTVAATVALPDAPGEYRLFADIDDGHDGAATANVPMLVEPGE